MKESALKWALWAAVFLAPLKATMVATTFLVGMDLVVGIWSALKRREPITSSKLSRTVTKTIGYQLGLITAYVTETVMVPEIPVVKAVAGIVAATEILSIFESLSSITGVPLHERIKGLFDRDPNKP